MEQFQKRTISLMLLFLVFSITYVGRLGWLQLVQGPNLATMAANYHSRTVFFRWGHGSEGRGTIYDRNMRPLTSAELRPGLAVFPAVGRRYPDFDEWLDIISSPELTPLDREQIIFNSSLRRPIPLNNPLPQDLELPHWIQPIIGDWDEKGIFTRYTYGKLAEHTLGWTTGIQKEDEVVPGLRIGRQGIEKAFDEVLRTTRPGVSAVVDAQNRIIPGLGYRINTHPDDEPNVVLTLDLEIQRIVENIFDAFIARGDLPEAGAIVVMDPNTGDILAMASRPNIHGAKHQHNRATRKSDKVDILPPSSVIKVLTAAAALDHDPGLMNYTYTCTGTLTLGGNTFRCIFGPHGYQDLPQALANSCNLYFASLAMEVGRRPLLEMAEKMGLGTRPELGLPAGEVGSGSIPSLEDLATAAGITNHFAMGSNKLEATPVQVAALISSIANGGYKVEPRLVLGVNHQEGQRIPSPTRPQRIMNSTSAQQVASMMRLSVTEGTSKFNQGRYPYAAMNLASKTGTSDAGLPPLGYQVRWNAGFFPWQNPQYVVVYMAEVEYDDVLNRPTTRVLRNEILAEITQALSNFVR